ncbi:hypothetical protein VIBNISO65_740017 [Vibrio nigripulchritudo SO65]|uniref:hypothetical protein n=1 Tax=Vibrio nigripulchritudo TaxID=28173 RepID=UPI0003B2353A|nr:hypothetical protein [Vibrio nigripulchritudo]CCN34129.1 hypothetical protein VIBNIAM115_140026 [Vibrio nigripulchritudo AM115]CCN43571.1 hypothetical protein VIBNIFTn2_570026 [Vibrio nigripulchritudo FTn2]CCN64691.1 hypothetical protein VIBNIPon4_260017 [Vibrio nigripulchritudo POn4]CCN78740.1 hypothetical protein VIBNISO65_740017 [Vibrio nigripulchritudo SO65]
MTNSFDLYLKHPDGQLQSFAASEESTLDEEAINAIAQSKDPIVLAFTGNATPATLDSLFALMQQLYRPLMRKRGCQFWVYWNKGTDPVIQTGAQTLCQIAAMELAGKKARINFLYGDMPFTSESYPSLSRMQGIEYLTAQSVEWSPQPLQMA